MNLVRGRCGVWLDRWRLVASLSPGRVVGTRSYVDSCIDTSIDEARCTTRFSVTFVAGNRLCLGGLGQCVQKCFSLDNKPKENDMSKRGRKRRDRRKNGANHGKRPNA